jgi:hypothetical protein
MDGGMYSSVCEVNASGAALYCIGLFPGKFV